MSPHATQQPTDVELKPVSPTHASTTRSTGGNAPRNVSNQTVKPKETTISSPASPPKQSHKQAQTATHNPAQSQMKKLSRKSSKPIINWLQRKLAGSVRSRRASDADAFKAPRPVKDRSLSKEQRRRSSVPAVPPMPLVEQNKKGDKGSQGKKLDPVVVPKRNTISLDGSDDYNSYIDRHTVDSLDDYRGSFARDSLWSPTSISVREADEDASVRPLPPSAPPSPSPSHSSSSYLSDPRTFASMAASTKPTTLLSVDLAGGGMAHIAQAPPTPTLAAHRLGPHARAHSTAPSTVGSITFSTLPASASSRPSPTGPGNLSRGSVQHGTLNAPQHTTHHPRYNPRPSSPPPDDASVLTLASSAFGIPGSRVGANALTGRRSLADDSFSHISGAPGIGDSVSHFTPGDLDGDDDRLTEADRDGDVDASVRALRPRSSRRGSWESEASGWSAHLGTGTPSIVRDRSLWTTPSLRTGTRSVNLATEEEYPDRASSNHDDRDDRSLAFTTFTTSEAFREEELEQDKSEELSPIRGAAGEHEPPTSSHGASQDTERPQSPTRSSVTENGGPGAATPKRDKGQETPKVSNLSLEDHPPPMPSMQDSVAKEILVANS
ncbi:hypothetical protein BDY19DRAFT_1083906 [Irpex rosettiformis]|uniref:Uncharacterized protein n=1 Tax=Irpex rosettiformis TaxID=378272 RepID=A0ACB8UEH8_9APHY|nr:hypothetical protein BDY19DRAFT_1083906 [Irpex rosettiformis]